jgi:ABC-type branched-subunit amino acid transport system ATPase component
MGKTTLLKALIGQLPVTAGTIRFAGADITRQPAYRRARAGIGYVPQGRAIFSSLTVRDNLRMASSRTASTWKSPWSTTSSLDFRALDPLIDRIGGTLSGGEQQILALARCLCGRPKLLLLDEPTEGIQPSIVDEILEILVGLHRHQGLAVIVVEQSLEFIRSLSQRTLLIEKGVITGEVPPESLGQGNALGGFLAAE